MRGRFITLEGPEGCGKSTQIGLIEERLRAAGVSVVSLREPGGTATGEALRNILQHDASGEDIRAETELLLFEASRAQLVQQVIAPVIARGEWVLCDRFTDSTTAYQGYGRGFDVTTIEAINRFATGGLEPDLTVLIDLDLDQALARMQSRNRELGAGEDRFEREARDFHDRVREGYLALARANPQRIRVIDGEGAVSAIAEAVWRHVSALLPASAAAGGGGDSAA